MGKVKKLIMLLFIVNYSFSQKTMDEIKDEIREMEKREMQAYIAQDSIGINNVWAKDIAVNSPVNRINQSSILLTKLLLSGVIQHKAIIRNIEEIFIYEGIAISMGNEEVTNMDDSTLKRRYTNTWVKEKGEWRMKFRHANIICK